MRVTRREVIRAILEGRKPPYVPWEVGFTGEAWAKLSAHYGDGDAWSRLDNHLMAVGGTDRFFSELPNGRVRDFFGVEWDRSVDKDIGVVANLVLPGPSLKGYAFPDPFDPMFFDGIPAAIAARPKLFRVFSIGFSLYERAWTMRGMENLLEDMIENPLFVHELLDAIADWNIVQVRKAVQYDIDAVYFGDDWGQQRGLQMGPALWRAFILPRLKRMYGAVRQGGKFVMIHSCGDVDELFDDLIDAGLNCFNPFQPEVMDVAELVGRYRGRLAFHGGLSTQRILPYGTPEEVRCETRRLIDLGREGGYIFAPAHAVPRDVPAENMAAFLEVLHEQPGAPAEG
jgi:uroporphyrinogen decarboxylase